MTLIAMFRTRAWAGPLLLSLVVHSTAQGQGPPRHPITRFSGESYSGPLDPLNNHQQELAQNLRATVQKLAVQIGPRSVYQYDKLLAAAEYIEQSLEDAGYKIFRQTYQIRGRHCFNIIVEQPGGGNSDEIVVIGAHYDSVSGSPGANDNGSGAAANLELARHSAALNPDRTLRFVFFVNEENPFFQTEEMGSHVYARYCKQDRQKIVAMLSLETVGYYSDQANSQHYPAPYNRYYPATGNFIGIVGNVESTSLVTQVVESFRKHAKFPSEGGALPAATPGVGWSDHWSFWQMGYPAVMITDTALYRYPHYHRASDTADKIDYDRLARVVAGLEKVVEELSSPER